MSTITIETQYKYSLVNIMAPLYFASLVFFQCFSYF